MPLERSVCYINADLINYHYMPYLLYLFILLIFVFYTTSRNAVAMMVNSEFGCIKLDSLSGNVQHICV